MIRHKLLILILIFIPIISTGTEYEPKDGVDIIGTKAPPIRRAYMAQYKTSDNGRFKREGRTD